MSQKTIIFLGDGMADEPVPELNGKTPLQHAKTPGMDSIARDGRSGTLLTLPEGFPTSSEVANMSVLGCNLEKEYCGRGPLEAIGGDIELAPTDIAFRLNLSTAQDGILTDFSGGHLDQNTAEELISCLNDRFGNSNVRFEAGVSYRNLLILSGDEFSHEVSTEKPDDNHGEIITDHLPKALNSNAQHTEKFLVELIKKATPFLENCEANTKLKADGKPVANTIWPWSGGQAGALIKLTDKYGICGVVISAVNVIMGLGKCLGLTPVRVSGATGYIDTNYEGKANAAIKALKDHDFVYLHLEAIDEVSHEKDLNKKIKAIEDFDSKIVLPVLTAISPDVNVAILPDHPVPVSIGKHTRTPVPVAVRMSNAEPDSLQVYDEISAPTGSLGEMKENDLMELLF